jgi:hypothetical protein
MGGQSCVLLLAVLLLANGAFAFKAKEFKVCVWGGGRRIEGNAVRRERERGLGLARQLVSGTSALSLLMTLPLIILCL